MNDSRQESYPCSFLFKVLLTGDSGVGKSSMLYRFTDDAFREDTVSNAHSDCRVKKLIHKSNEVTLQLWDKSRQEKYLGITIRYYIDVDAVILVYDVTNQESFLNLKDWLRDIATYTNDNVITIIVGNKCDQTEKRTVDKEIAKKFAREEGVQYVEVSAKTGDNVADLFEKIMNGLLSVNKSSKNLKFNCCSIL